MSQLEDTVGQIAERETTAASEAYSQMTLLRTTIAAIGAIGGPFALVSALDAWLSTRGQNIAAARLQRTLNEIASQSRNIEEQKLDKQYLESESFYDLCWSTFRKAQRTASREKARLYVRILMQSATGAPHRENADEYLALLAELSETEVRVASAAFKFQENVIRSPKDVFAEIETSNMSNEEAYHHTRNALAEARLSIGPGDLRPFLDANLDEALIDSYLTRLQRTGLITPIVHEELDESWHLSGGFRVSKYFRHMMTFLNSDGELLAPIWE